MREPLRDASRLRHMIEAIDHVNEYLTDKSELDLSTNSMLFYAVVKNIEIVGEAAYKLTHEFRESHPTTPWREIIAMRHILVYGYYKVTASEVYNVYKEDLPSLKAQLISYIAESWQP